jgi:hypothetical protein
MSKDLAPIIVFGFNRPIHLEKTLEALSGCVLFEKSLVFIILDGARGPLDVEACQAVLDLCMKFAANNKNVTVEVRCENFGLAKNIITAVSEVVTKFQKVIVLEDDLVVSPVFIEYMNNGLEMYQKDKEVWHVSGWSPEYPSIAGDVYFSKKMFCWGWATWIDRWQHFSKDPNKLISKWTPSMIHRFNYDSTANHWGQILSNYLGITDTWAIFWQVSVAENNGVCINPCKSLVRNIGFDESGTNWHLEKYKELDQSVSFDLPNFDLRGFDETPITRSTLKSYFSNNRSLLLILLAKVLTRIGLYTVSMKFFLRIRKLTQFSRNRGKT